MIDNSRAFQYREEIYVYALGKIYSYNPTTHLWVVRCRTSLPGDLKLKNGKFYVNLPEVEKVTTSSDCVCNLTMIMRIGCQCGGE